MAVTQASVSNIANWAKDQYYGPFEDMLETFNTTSYFLNENLFGRELARVPDGGNQFVFPLATGRYMGFGGRGDTSTLASPRDRARQRATGTLVPLFHRGRYSGTANRRSRSAQYNYFETYDDLLVNLPRDFGKLVSDMCWRSGDGILARVNDASPDTSLVIDQCGTAAGAAEGSGIITTFGTRHLHAGMEFETWSSITTNGTSPNVTDHEVGSASNSGLTSSITSVDSETLITVASAGNTADNDWLTLSTDVTNDTSPQEMTGLAAHVSDLTTVHGINKATNAYFQPAFDTGSDGDATAFDLTHFDVAVRQITHTVGPDRVGRLVALVEPAMMNVIANEMKDLVQFDSDDFDLEWGWSTVSYRRGGVRLSIAEDQAAHCGAIYYLDPQAFRFMQSMEPQVLREDGLEVRNVADTDTYEMMYGWDAEFVCVNPKFTGRRIGYTTTGF